MIINNIDFAKDHESLTGVLNIDDMQRINDVLNGASGQITFKLQGSINKINQPMLNLSIYGKITTSCQSCLNEIDLSIQHLAEILILENEDELDKVLFDEEVDKEGILASSEFSVSDFIEEELILLLPLAPKHDSCAKISYKSIIDNPFSKFKK